MTNLISVASGVSYDWTTAHQGELQVLGTGKVNLKQSGSIVRLTGNKATDYYTPSDEKALAWNDPRVGIEWPLEPGQQPLVSAKDQVAAAFADAVLY